MSNEVSRNMPCSIEAEQYILGAAIFDNECVSDIIEKLKIDDFYLQQHKKIFEAIINITNKAKNVDIITLKDDLGANFDSIGGAEYLTQITLMVSTTANIENYIEIIKDKSVRRNLIKASNEIMDICYDSEAETPIVINSAETKIFEISQSKDFSELTPIKNILSTNLSKIEELMRNKGALTGITSGFRDLDSRTAGLQSSDLILIAARPSMGKTSFVLNIAINAALSGVPVAVFSLEMSKEQLVSRILCSDALIESDKMRVGNLDATDLEKMAKSMDRLSGAPMYIDDTPGITVAEIRAKCRRLKLKNNLGLVVIDYLQLMQGSRRDNRQQEISEISRFLKVLAKELDVPVITLSQLSRAPEQRPNHRPQLSDLRESGSIEQDADIVMFLYRDEYYNPDTEFKNVCECIIAKNRNGSTDTFKLGWRGEYTKFMDLDITHVS